MKADEEVIRIESFDNTPARKSKAAGESKRTRMIERESISDPAYESQRRVAQDAANRLSRMPKQSEFTLLALLGQHAACPVTRSMAFRIAGF